MKKLFLFIFVLLATTPVFAADSSDKPATQPRISIFSTSTDWQALTGLLLYEYRGKFIPDNKLIGKGLVLYYLDGFPCYGLGEGVRVWLGPKNKHDGDLRIACVYPPKEIKFTWRNALRDADEAVSSGLLTCPVTGDGELTIDLSKCDQETGWDKLK